MVMFFIPVVNTRALVVDDVGIYRQFWLLFDTVSVFLIMGFPNSLLYYFPRSDTREEKSTYLTQTLVYLIMAGMLSWGVYGVLDLVLGEGLGELVGTYFWPLCLFTLFMIFSKFLERVFVADRQAERQSAYAAVSFSVQALTVILISGLTHNVTYIIRGLVAFSFLRFLFAAGYAWRAYHPSLGTVSWASFREQASYAMPLGLASVVLMLFAKTDKYVIIHYMGREAFAVYSIGALQIPFIDIIRNSIYNVAFPMMARYQKDGNPGEILSLWHRATLKTAVLFFPLFVFLEVSMKPFITVLFTQRYVDATPVAMVYMLIFLRSTVETGSVLMTFKRTAFMFKINAIGFLCHIGFSILMYKTFGRIGVPFATVIIVYLQNAAALVMGARLLNVSLYRVMPWGKLIVRFLVAVVPGALLAWGYRYYPVEGFVGLAVAGLLYAAVYFAVCFRVGFITPREVRSILGRD